MREELYMKQASSSVNKNSPKLTQTHQHTAIMTVAESKIQIKPFPRPQESRRDLGAEAYGVDLHALTDADFELIRQELYNHQVLVIKNQSGASPKAQYELTRLFDPESQSYGHDKTVDAERSILHPDLKTVPHQPQVQVIGQGFVKEFEGLHNITLKNPHHRTFHKYPVPEEEDLEVTRFYRWHIDAALYGLNPPRTTTLMAVSVPKGEPQMLRYDDGTGDEVKVPLGTTAFASGYTMYDILSDEDKEFVRTTKVQYAPHPYIWITAARALSTGLGLYSDGLELSRDELPPVDESKIKILPMAWKNPITGRLALQVHACGVEKLHLADGTVINNLEEVRRIVNRLQRPGIAPDLVYFHDWQEGDMVLFNNHGVIHSVVGSFTHDQVRIFRQCNLAASEEPLGPDAQIEVA